MRAEHSSASRRPMPTLRLTELPLCRNIVLPRGLSPRRGWSPPAAPETGAPGLCSRAWGLSDSPAVLRPRTLFLNGTGEAAFLSDPGDRSQEAGALHVLGVVVRCSGGGDRRSVCGSSADHIPGGPRTISPGGGLTCVVERVRTCAPMIHPWRVIVRDSLETRTAEEPRPNTAPIHLHACTRCAGLCSSLSILDSRGGKAYRLFKCTGCGDLSWTEDE